MGYVLTSFSTFRYMYSRRGSVMEFTAASAQNSFFSKLLRKLKSRGWSKLLVAGLLLTCFVFIFYQRLGAKRKTVLPDNFIPQKANQATAKALETKRPILKQESVPFSVLKQEPSPLPVLKNKLKAIVDSERILIAVFTTSKPDKFIRRNLIRNTYLKYKPLHFDFKFVIGKTQVEEDESLIAFESSLYHDILHLNVIENMDDGKTIDFFTTIAAGKRYRLVMKTDDDVFLHLPNLATEFKRLPSSEVYWGRQVINFNAGAGYAVSWDYIQRIASSKSCQEGKKWQEDSHVAACINGVLTAPLNPEDIYDAPQSGRGWAHPYTSSTLFIHQLKRTDWFLDTAKYFDVEIKKSI